MIGIALRLGFIVGTRKFWDEFLLDTGVTAGDGASFAMAVSTYEQRLGRQWGEPWAKE